MEPADPEDPLLARLAMPRVVVLVGTSGSGKTTLRRRLVSAGLPPAYVVSLDDLRREARAEDLSSRRGPRPLQAYSAAAVRHAARRTEALAALRTGYLADATHLTRRERRWHVRVAEASGLQSAAVLTPLVALEVLLTRNAARPADERVPVDALTRQHHRRSLLTPSLLAAEGFTAVHEL